MSKAKDKHPTTQVTMVVEHIKQDPGAVQVTCSVYVNVPGKHFPNLSAAEEAGSAGPVLIACMVKVHYNWKYIYLRPTVKQVIERYNKKFRPTMYCAQRCKPRLQPLLLPPLLQPSLLQPPLQVHHRERQPHLLSCHMHLWNACLWNAGCRTLAGHGMRMEEHLPVRKACGSLAVDCIRSARLSRIAHGALIGRGTISDR